MSRLGYRNGSNVIETYPDQYATGEDFDRFANPTFTMLFFDVNNFAVLTPGTEQITTALYNELAAEAGAGGPGGVALDDYAGLLQNLGLTAVTSVPVSIFDDFDGDSINVEWQPTNASGATTSQSAVAGEHAALLTTGTTDEAYSTFARNLIYTVSDGLKLIEARFKVSAITDVVFEIGFSDAISETNGMAFSSHDSTPVAVATNAAVIAWHAENTTPGETSTHFEVCTVKASTATRTATSVALTAATFFTMAIAIDEDGDMSFYINGENVGNRTAGIATSAVLTPWVSIVCKEASASRVVTLDWIRITGER